MKMDDVLKDLTLDYLGKGKYKTTPEDFLKVNDGCLLDVRTQEEASAISINMEHLPNIQCKNIPVNEIPERYSEIPKGKSIAVFCPANVRASMAYLYLRTKGYTNIRIMLGGYAALTDAVKPGKILKALA
ncbi:MAG: rhodanese-like domain-containing protein [Lentisphaeria bacterium]